MHIAFIILGTLTGLTVFAASVALGLGIGPAVLLLSMTATLATLIAMVHTAHSRGALSR